ncbi:DUF6339 family protein [Actinoplanes xinjiangensis]|uniref:Uncharacterized protein n=1 Tax=Actinoplanes xinjiangensis TaxID=512350 RepID=A0A316EVC0_9ACTN|nr:DUF6339 family protein [Actinoplanes xinjiangensis]PWK35843.1 hypothetical protein BC793_12544 [Actinoplanes xinjiangensis]GIF43026.1 hypothetical protein Axi01nite_73370 [Actinoplanes xinjiangensis]
MAEPILCRFKHRISVDLRDRLVRRVEQPDEHHEPIRRPDGSTIDLTVVDVLMGRFSDRFADLDQRGDRAASDRWLAPRLHYALRLTRAEAADRDLWAWLAVRYSDYVAWRWAGAGEKPTEDRWNGQINKQALMRLWWGAELFRNGPDYSPVERAFSRQDVPHNLLHRTLVRCRSLAVALVDDLVPADQEVVGSSREIRDLARVLNLVMAGSPPELETDLQQDDHRAYDAWVREFVLVPADWDLIPRGPVADDTTPSSLAGGRAITERGRRYAAVSTET